MNVGEHPILTFDPSGEPWGTAVSICAALVGVALVTLVLSKLTRRSLAPGRALLGVALALFCAATIGGTVSRTLRRRAAETLAKAVDAKGDPTLSAGAVDPATQDGPKKTPLVAPPPFEIPVAKPLPAEPTPRAQQVRERIDNAKRTADEPRQCVDPQTLVNVWVDLHAIPSEEPGTDDLAQVIRDLETCRKKVAWTAAYEIRRDRVEARNAFARLVGERYSDATGKTSAEVSGKDHNLLHVSVPGRDEQWVTGALASGLKDELARMGFTQVVFDSGEAEWNEDLEPTEDAASVDARMQRYGLGESFTAAD